MNITVLVILFSALQVCIFFFGFSFGCLHILRTRVKEIMDCWKSTLKSWRSSEEIYEAKIEEYKKLIDILRDKIDDEK